jgi:hypothetical protein
MKTKHAGDTHFMIRFAREVAGSAGWTLGEIFVFGLGLSVVLALSLVLDAADSFAADRKPAAVHCGPALEKIEYSATFVWKNETMRIEVGQLKGNDRMPAAFKHARIVKLDPYGEASSCQAVCEGRRSYAPEPDALDFACKDNGLGQMNTHMALMESGHLRFGTWTSGYVTADLRPLTNAYGFGRQLAGR